MSVGVQVFEEPRVFDVRVGTMQVGRVTVYGQGSNPEPCLAEFQVAGSWIDYGWHRTIRVAAGKLVRRQFGVGSADVVERKNAP